MRHYVQAVPTSDQLYVHVTSEVVYILTYS